MDNRVKELILGYDLCNDYIQISCYNQKSKDMDTICYVGEKMLDRIPTVLCRLYADKTWVCGYDAWRAVNENRGVLVENLVDGLAEKREAEVDGDIYESSELIRIFVRESLQLITKYYPHWCIGRLTISLEQFGEAGVQALMPLAEEMNFNPSRLTVINHVSAFEYYTLNQKKELWQHDVGLFDYSRRGMVYYHLTTSKKRVPVAAMAITMPLGEYFDGSEIEEMAPPERDRQFLEVVRKVTANKIISAVYLTGEGFEGEWLNISLKSLCHHRKGFIGSNIFSRGACYYALTEAGILEENRFIALNEDVISKTIYIRGSKEGELVTQEIVQAGQIWYEVQAEAFFIPDQRNQVTLHLMDFLSHKERSVEISLENLEKTEDRPEKTRLLRLSVRFDTASDCRVQIEDLGFGDFYPPSDTVIEKVFNIYDETLNDREVVEEGRLLLMEGQGNTIPYHFELSGMRVYNLEQLSYYLGHYIYTINPEIFDESLFYWLEKNLGRKSIARELREGIKNNQSLKHLVSRLLMAADYYSAEEIREIQHQMERIEAQNPIETRKTEGDNYLRYGRALEALTVYKRVEGMMEDSEELITNEFKGNLFHNMGVAFARLVNGDAAIACFKKAYDLNQAEASREGWLQMLRIQGRQDEMVEVIGSMLLPPEKVNQMEQRFERAQEHFEAQKSFEILKGMQEVHSEDSWKAVEADVEKWLEAQKEEYRH